MKEIFQNTFLTIVSIFATLYFLELSLGLYSYIQSHQQEKLSLIRHFDQNKTPNTYILVTPGAFISNPPKSYRRIPVPKVLPFGGISKSRATYCNEGEGYITYETDRFGFRNPDSVWDDKDLNAVLIGDSFLNGACTKEDIGSIIRKISGKKVADSTRKCNLEAF